MNFRTFFLILFVVSISLCIGSILMPDSIQNILSQFDVYHTFNMTFLGLLFLITAILSYIGLVISSYFEKKREEERLARQKRDRVNIEAIHEEIQALHKAQ